MKKFCCCCVENFSTYLQQLLSNAMKSHIEYLPLGSTTFEPCCPLFLMFLVSFQPVEPMVVFLWVRKRLSEGAGVWAELRCPSQHRAGMDGALQECSLSALATH